MAYHVVKALLNASAADCAAEEHKNQKLAALAAPIGKSRKSVCGAVPEGIQSRSRSNTPQGAACADGTQAGSAAGVYQPYDDLKGALEAVALASPRAR